MRRSLLIGSALVGMITLTFALVALWFLQRDRIAASLLSNGAASSQPTVTTAPPSSSRSARPTPSAAAQASAALPSSPTSPATETTAPLPPPASEVAFVYDDFARPDSGFAPLSLDAAQNFTGYSSGRYRIRTMTSGQLVYDMRTGQLPATGSYQIDVGYEHGTGSFGLLIGVEGDPTSFDSLSFYAVGLTSSGSVFVSRKEAGSALETLTAMKVSVNNPQRTQLRIDTDSDGLTVRLDDAEAVAVPDIPTLDGQIGMFALAEATPLHVSFDNLLVMERQPSAQPLWAALRPLGLTSAIPLRGADVALARERLSRLGYATDGPTDVYDTAFGAVVRTFQERNNLEISATVDSMTWGRLLSSDAVTADGITEDAAVTQHQRVVTLDSTALPAPVLVSVRQTDTSWRIALALPGEPQIIYLETDGEALDPAWSPDRRFLAFSRSRGAASSVWLMDTTSGAIRDISPAALNAEYPAWSPDSRLLTYTVETGADDSSARVALFDISSGQTSLLSDAHGGWADWSRNNEIIFTRWTGVSYDLFRSRPDGSELINLTNSDAVDEDIAAWSPDGQLIAFVLNPRGQSNERQIFVMTRDGADVRPLTTSVGPHSNPIWLPDGQTIIFAQQPAPDVWQPWLMTSDGSFSWQLSNNTDRIWFMNAVPVEE